MDKIEIATREQHIKSLEEENRKLHAQVEALRMEFEKKDDIIRQLAVPRSADVTAREARIADLVNENNALRAESASYLATARAHRDEYDALCNELGALGVDLPQLRGGKIKVVPT